MSKKVQKISIITTLYRSESFLDVFIEKCYSVMNEIDCPNFEIVMVNDGSPDNSLIKALELKKNFPQIKIVDLARNFGHHFALIAGLRYASGDLMFLIDCDLEVSPAVLSSFYAEYKKNDCDVVYGYQEERKGKWIEKQFGGLFWKAFNFLSDTKTPPNQLTERLMTQKYVKALLEMGDKSIFLAGMMYWTGFKQIGVPVVKGLRAGKSTYTLKKRIALSIDAIVSFSAYPLKLFFRLGVVITILSFLYGSYLLIQKILYPKIVVHGYTSLAILILFSTGIIVTVLGVLGIYIEKMYNQIKNRPLFTIKDIYE